MGSTLFRDPQARSSALAAYGTLQPRALGSLNRVDPLDSVSNYYIISRSANVPEVHINTYNFIFFADISKIERAEVAC